MPIKKLDELQTGEKGIVVKLSGNPALRQRLRALGIREGKEIIKKREGPFGDPIAIETIGVNLTLRRQLAHHVFVEITGKE